MSWLRRLPAFFVRCAESVPSPCCGEALSVIGSRKRKVISEGGEDLLLVIRRLRCSQCRKIHHELPDCILPYKRYESACARQVVSSPSSLSAVTADDATLRRWKIWFQDHTTYLLGALRSIAILSTRTLQKNRPSLRLRSRKRWAAWNTPHSGSGLRWSPATAARAKRRRFGGLPRCWIQQSTRCFIFRIPSLHRGISTKGCLSSLAVNRSSTAAMRSDSCTVRLNSCAVFIVYSRLSSLTRPTYWIVRC